FAAFQNLVTSLQRTFKSGAIFALLFRRHAAALDRSSAAVNRESNFFCFHIWIVIGPYFGSQLGSRLRALGQPRRRSIKEHESKEAIGCASSHRLHGFKRNAAVAEMSKRLIQRLRGRYGQQVYAFP